MLFGNRPADKTAKWRVTTRSFVVLLAYTLFIWWLEVLDLLAWLLHVPQGTVLSRAAALVLCGAVMASVDSIYYIPNLRNWFVESTLYPFIGGDTVRRDTVKVVASMM